MAIFYAAIPIGSALGFMLGGLVDKAAGWRAAFFVAGAPGMLLAILAARMPDPPRGAQDAGEPTVALPLGATYARLLANRPYVLTVLGYAAYTFAVGGMAFWMPSFLERVRGVPKAEATTVFGAILVGTGFAGTFLGGWLGDHLLKKHPQAYLTLSGVATLLAVPLAYLVFTASQPAVYYTAIVLAEILLFTSTGPINSALLNAVAPAERASAIALSIFAIHILGDVPSPAIIGILSDASSLQSAVMIVPIAVAVSGVLWCTEAILANRRAV
jgi:predicted MFS family arabinose efflux permease